MAKLGSTGSIVLDPELGPEADSRKLPSSKFKGVVPQPNGRWGAQIYEKHQRVWLGTFSDEQAAARAYDIAAHRFRGRDATTNFPPLSDQAELFFINSRSKAEIVDMLRKHTYADELLLGRRALGAPPAELPRASGLVVGAREWLFEKTVTPSDVGKLNRLVIPKQHAEKYFPINIAASKGVLLNLEDLAGKAWRFRYSYWNSSQSYVFTKGWSRFVKEKGLKAGDIVSFQRSTGLDRQLFIEWKPRSVKRPVRVVRLFGVTIAEEEGNNEKEMEMELDQAQGPIWKKRFVGVF